MPNKIKFTTQSVPGSLSKGNARISTGGAVGPTHDTGFFNGINPPVNGYTFYMKKTGGIVEDGLVFAIDAGHYSSYRPELELNEVWDLSGNGYNSIMYNGVSYNNTYNSFVTDGVNDYIKTNDIIISNPTQLTIEGWIMKGNYGNGSYETILHQSADTSIGSSSYWLGFTSANELCATIGARTSVGWAAGNTSVVVNYDTWYHLVASWDGSVVKVYINGIYNKQYNLTAYSNLTTPTRLGASGDGTGYLVGGEIGPVRIYNIGLTETQIQQNFNTEKERFGL